MLGSAILAFRNREEKFQFVFQYIRTHTEITKADTMHDAIYQGDRSSHTSMDIQRQVVRPEMNTLAIQDRQVGRAITNGGGGLT